MQSRQEQTDMIHLECGVCGVSATCVATPTADLAWHDHMAIHADQSCFSAWTWTVQRLPGL